MTKKIFRSIVLAVAVVLVISFSVVTLVLYNNFSQVSSDKLADQLHIVSTSVELMGDDYLSAFQSENYRVTWIDTDGTVLFDTEADSDSMDNHSNREEIEELKRAKTCGLEAEHTLDKYIWYTDGNWHGFSGDLQPDVKAPYIVCPLHTKEAWEQKQKEEEEKKEEEEGTEEEGSGEGETGEGETGTGEPTDPTSLARRIVAGTMVFWG